MTRNLFGPLVLILGLAATPLAWSKSWTDGLKLVDIRSLGMAASSDGVNRGEGLAVVSGVAPGGTAPDGLAPLPDGDKLVLPLQVGMTARVIFIASGTNAHPITDPIFLVDRDGLPWMSAGKDHLVSLRTRTMIIVDKKFQDAAIFKNGQIVLCADDSIGTLDEASPEEKKNNKFLMHFHPQLALPYKNMRLFAGENDTMYVVGKNPSDGKDELFLTVDDGGGKKDFLKLLAIKEGISAVAGDGRTTYFASGPLIVKVGSDHKRMERVIKLSPEYPIKELAYSSKAGLFFSDSKGVGYVGAKKPLIIVEGPDVSIRMRDDSLFVLFVKEQEVLKFENVSGFSKLLGRK